MSKEEIKNKAYGLMVMLGEIENELRRGGDAVTLDEIQSMGELASEINQYFEDESHE